jgi:hypothetical protein
MGETIDSGTGHLLTSSMISAHALSPHRVHDFYLISSWHATNLWGSSAIRRIISQLGDGTYQLYESLTPADRLASYYLVSVGGQRVLAAVCKIEIQIPTRSAIVDG